MTKLSTNIPISISKVGEKFTVYTENFPITVILSNSFGITNSQIIGERNKYTFIKSLHYPKSRTVEFKTLSDKVDVKIP